ncbi:hypothetical protein INT45_007306 [Circinella minor]|uniref:Uncharacterized protein n=1 Tax=Circinella minor TaxID=1195481 RepID=A0A8H7S1K8_9FUNG|nr:hypothetical protein INT45_007306 [Circinella minor]
MMVSLFTYFIITYRFGSMKLGLISSCSSITTLADSLDIKTLNTISTKVILETMNQLDVLLVDMSDQPNQMNDIMAEILDTTPDLLKCTVMHGTMQQLQQEKQYDKEDDKPIQSGTTKNGVQVDVLESDYLVCAYYHDGSTRRDNVHEFSIQDIVKNGCNGSILAWHYLAEIGHKLGHVPKYGA